MKKTIFSLSLLALFPWISGIAQQPIKNQKKSQEERIWHYSMIDAMRRGIYEGTHTVKELKTHGDFGYLNSWLSYYNMKERIQENIVTVKHRCRHFWIVKL